MSRVAAVLCRWPLLCEMVLVRVVARGIERKLDRSPVAVSLRLPCSMKCYWIGNPRAARSGGARRNALGAHTAWVHEIASTSARRKRLREKGSSMRKRIRGVILWSGFAIKQTCSNYLKEYLSQMS